MNLLGIFCCREKSKPPQPKKVVSALLNSAPEDEVMNRNRKISFLEPTSDPYTMKDRYKGEKLGEVPNGNGQMMYKNGDYYRGQWVNGQKQGRGVQIYHQQGIQYEGEWKENMQNGQGKITYEDGSFYVGEFKDNQKHGPGQFHDLEKKQLFEQFYENGVLKKQKAKQIAASKEQQFPTLVLDKERFNSEDLDLFQKQNPEIKELQVDFLNKYYSICRITSLSFIKKNIKEWDDKDVREFLQAIDLSHCNEVFYTNKIKGSHLITITEKQMKDDLNLKLGDRKRLLNFCKYLGSIYNLNKNGKKNLKKPLPPKRSMPTKLYDKSSSDRYLNPAPYKTANIEDIIEEESNKESFENSEESSQFLNRREAKKEIKKEAKKEVINDRNYDTDQHSVFYSSHVIDTTNKPTRRQSRTIPKSQTSSSSENLEMSAVRNTASIRKKSSDNADDEFHGVKNLVYMKGTAPNYLQVQNQLLAIEADHSSHSSKGSNHYDHSDQENKQQRMTEYPANGANGHNHHNGAMNGKDKKNHKKNKDSSSSSDSSLSSVELELARKRTTNPRAMREGGMEIRELYEFLKERGNLDFIIKSKEIEILELIGQGGYGKVYKGKYMSCPVAVKDYIKTGKYQSQEDFLKELQILSDLKHPNIVLYMGICITTDKYQLVTEYLDYGSLFDQIHKKKKQFTKDEILDIVDDMVKGMVYLHNMKDIMHRDLKSSNVLIDEDWKVKLCDFGLSGHKKKSKKKNKGRIGTYQWMAPEVMKKEEMDFSSDVYSFGVVVWELLTGKIPYEGYTEAQIIGEVGYDQNYRLPLEEGGMWTSNDFMVQLMYECLQREPTQRPTFREIQDKLDAHFQMLEDLKAKSRSI